MDPLEPWIDASAARRMAERLLAKVEDPEVKTGPDTGFGTDFVGFATEKERSETQLVETPVAEEEPARVFEPVATVQTVAAPSLPEANTEPSAESVPAVAAASPRGPLLERLARFRDALIRHTSAQGAFVLDREGRPVMEDPAFGKLHFLARSLAQAYRPVSGHAGNVHVKIGANAVLEVVPVDTPFGCLVLGAIVPKPLAASVVAEIAEALKKAATPREGGN